MLYIWLGFVLEFEEFYILTIKLLVSMHTLVIKLMYIHHEGMWRSSVVQDFLIGLKPRDQYSYSKLDNTCKHGIVPKLCLTIKCHLFE